MSDSEPLVEDLCGLYAGTAVAAYLNAFKVGEVDPFISYYTAPYTNPSAIYSRAEFLSLSLRAAGLLSRLRLSRGDTHVHFMSTNRVEDLAVRLASALLYTTPVTVNWQADTVDTVRYKVELADARVLLFDKGVSEDMLTELRTLLLPKGVLFVNIEDIYIEKPVKLEQLRGRLAPKCDEDTRMVIFTSGTTGRPKGVELTFDNYACNALTFDSFLDPHSNISPVCVLVNPLHHTNSTSLADWALRRGDATVHLLDKYTTSYWALLTNITAATRAGARVIAPLVSRHIDFLAALSEAHALGVESDVLRATLSQVVLLMGSSPVGPTTVERLQRIAGALPTVRFGSTETTLQVCGIPLTMSETEVLAAFRRGWEQKPLVGYFIGREHPGLTEVSVVRSVAPGLPGYMEPVDSGIPGLLITRGAHVMKAYLNSDSRPVENGWYLNLGDVGFWLQGADGGRDLYWGSRESNMLIRGGANYSYEAVQEEWKVFIETWSDLNVSQFTVAVCGVRSRSEHEDDLCVLLQPLDANATHVMQAEDFIVSLLAAARIKVSKGSKPDYVRVGIIPIVQSKGVIDIPSMRKLFEG